jgi:hypothetical protein
MPKSCHAAKTARPASQSIRPDVAVSATRFTLAGLGFELQAAGHEPKLQLPPAFEPFLSSDNAPPVASYRVSPDASAELQAIAKILWHCDTWRFGLTEAETYAIELHTVATDSWVPIANLSRDFSGGTINCRYGRWATIAPFVLNYPYDQAILLNRLVQFGAGVVHACGVVVDGRGLIFGGPSDVGKTTLARLWRKDSATLLNDDRVILRTGDGKATLSGSPWHGEESEVRAQTVPLRAIFHLKQARENKVRKLAATEALAKLIATTVAPFYLKENMERLLESWAQIVELVPSYVLEFTPDRRALDACRAALAKL